MRITSQEIRLLRNYDLCARLGKIYSPSQPLIFFSCHFASCAGRTGERRSTAFQCPSQGQKHYLTRCQRIPEAKLRLRHLGYEKVLVLCPCFYTTIMRGMEVAHQAGGQSRNGMPETFYKYSMLKIHKDRRTP